MNSQGAAGEDNFKSNRCCDARLEALEGGSTLPSSPASKFVVLFSSSMPSSRSLFRVVLAVVAPT